MMLLIQHGHKEVRVAQMVFLVERETLYDNVRVHAELFDHRSNLFARNDSLFVDVCLLEHFDFWTEFRLDVVNKDLCQFFF